jgi:shikimate kinase
VGEQAAHLLHCVYSDTDQLIRAQSGQTPGDIIRRRGEQHFRHLESTVLDHVPREPHQVIGLGGGFLTTAEGRAAARRKGLLLGLKATAMTIAARLKGDDTDRPLSEADRINNLLAARSESYRAVDVEIDAEGSSDAVSQAIVRCTESYRVEHQESHGVPVRMLSGPDLRTAVFGLASYPYWRAHEATIVSDDDTFDAIRLRDALAARRAPSAEADPMPAAVVAVGAGSAEALVAALHRLPASGPRHLIWCPKNVNALAEAQARMNDARPPDVGLALHVLVQTNGNLGAPASYLPASHQDLPFG